MDSTIAVNIIIIRAFCRATAVVHWFAKTTASTSWQAWSRGASAVDELTCPASTSRSRLSSAGLTRSSRWTICSASTWRSSKIITQTHAHTYTLHKTHSHHWSHCTTNVVASWRLLFQNWRILIVKYFKHSCIRWEFCRNWNLCV